VRSSDNALTVVAINKTAADLNSTVSIAGFAPAATASVYRYSSANLRAIEHLPDQPVVSTGFNAALPGNSITVYAIPASGGTANVECTASAVFADGTLTLNVPYLDYHSGYFRASLKCVSITAEMSCLR